MLREDASSREDFESAETMLATTHAELLSLNAKLVQAQIEVDNSSGWTKPVSAPAMSWISGAKLPVSVTLLSGQSMPVKKIFVSRA